MRKCFYITLSLKSLEVSANILTQRPKKVASCFWRATSPTGPGKSPDVATKSPNWQHFSKSVLLEKLILSKHSIVLSYLECCYRSSRVSCGCYKLFLVGWQEECCATISTNPAKKKNHRATKIIGPGNKQLDTKCEGTLSDWLTRNRCLVGKEQTGRLDQTFKLKVLKLVAKKTTSQAFYLKQKLATSFIVVAVSHKTPCDITTSLAEILASIWTIGNIVYNWFYLSLNYKAPLIGAVHQTTSKTAQSAKKKKKTASAGFFFFSPWQITLKKTF